MMWLLNLGFGASGFVSVPCNIDLATPIVNDSADLLASLSATPTDSLTALFPEFDVSAAIVGDSVDLVGEIDTTPTDILTDLC